MITKLKYEWLLLDDRVFCTYFSYSYSIENSKNQVEYLKDKIVW
jgi:hypothetical protein